MKRTTYRLKVRAQPDVLMKFARLRAWLKQGFESVWTEVR